MDQKIEFDNATQGMDFSGSTASGDSVATSRQGMTIEDVIYRVATVTTVLFILITML